MHDVLAHRIREGGFRATTPRLALLKFLEKSKRPQTILEIASGLRAVDQVTVYRIVEAFAKAGIIRELDLRQGKRLYELADPHDHHHVVCTGCGRIAEFTGCGVEEIEKKALRQARGFTKITAHAVELFGICKTCV